MRQSKNAYSRRRIFRGLTVFIILFLTFSLFFYFIFNGGAFWKEIRYAIFLNSPFVSSDLRNGEILNIGRSETLPPGTNYRLLIGKIEVDTPIVTPADNSTQSVLAALEDGVGIYPGSVAPGEAGRVIVLGHSSKASWYRGSYAYVFALLPQLQKGDKFYVLGKTKKYTYEVFSSGVMSPQDTNRLLSVEPADSEIALITCYPIGGASQRKVVQAKLIATENL